MKLKDPTKPPLYNLNQLVEEINRKLLDFIPKIRKSIAGGVKKNKYVYTPPSSVTCRSTESWIRLRQMMFSKYWRKEKLEKAFENADFRRDQLKALNDMVMEKYLLLLEDLKKRSLIELKDQIFFKRILLQLFWLNHIYERSVWTKHYYDKSINKMQKNKRTDLIVAKKQILQNMQEFKKRSDQYTESLETSRQSLQVSVEHQKQLSKSGSEKFQVSLLDDNILNKKRSNNRYAKYVRKEYMDEAEKENYNQLLSRLKNRRDNNDANARLLYDLLMTDIREQPQNVISFLKQLNFNNKVLEEFKEQLIDKIAIEFPTKQQA